MSGPWWVVAGWGGGSPCSEINWTELGGSCLLIQSDVKASSSGESTFAAKVLPFKGVESMVGLCQVLLVLLVISSWCCWPVLVSTVPASGASHLCSTGLTPCAVCMHVQGVCSVEAICPLQTGEGLCSAVKGRRGPCLSSGVRREAVPLPPPFSPDRPSRACVTPTGFGEGSARQTRCSSRPETPSESLRTPLERQGPFKQMREITTRERMAWALCPKLCFLKVM